MNNNINEKLDLVQKQITPGVRLASSTVQHTRHSLTMRTQL
ncbi:MAG TPA: hypothetical protein VFX02_08095 [Gammaproteobacteria bacterium]|nr:hypothetical protein [Gammaproteobacteria bacterium]